METISQSCASVIYVLYYPHHHAIIQVLFVVFWPSKCLFKFIGPALNICAILFSTKPLELILHKTWNPYPLSSKRNVRRHAVYPTAARCSRWCLWRPDCPCQGGSPWRPCRRRRWPGSWRPRGSPRRCWSRSSACSWQRRSGEGILLKGSPCQFKAWAL